ncbi:MAG TPA: carbohydrate binding family 9 domain-containing protein, partial [Thermoanaerobaculia bacterium]|nr:carbohydrate binding family 9 domain-containing protein [Thermoanaerobaculia bacterium]
MSRLVDALVAIGLGMAAGAAGEESAFAIHRAAGPITIDGDLSDPGWQGAARFQDFVEIRPGDGTAPDRRTTLLLAYDEKFLYAAFVCEDPDPSRIRAAFSDRDDVGTDQDYAGIFLDTRHDRRTVVEFFANPHGVQYDAVQDDATGNEDSTADFHWDSAGRIDAHGWTLEIRIPFSSLRYDKADPQTWGIIAYRNYTRDTRHSVSTSRIPRGSPCFVCHERDLVGLSGLPPGPHYVLAPYAAASQEAVQDPSAGA